MPTEIRIAKGDVPVEIVVTRATGRAVGVAPSNGVNADAAGTAANGAKPAGKSAEAAGDFDGEGFYESEGVSLNQEPLPPPSSDEAGPGWPDASAEASFLADARERGETVKPAKVEDLPDENDSKALPSLDAVVDRIPHEVRDALEDLFRAKFVKVQRVPKKALKK